MTQRVHCTPVTDYAPTDLAVIQRMQDCVCKLRLTSIDAHDMRSAALDQIEECLIEIAALTPGGLRALGFDALDTEVGETTSDAARAPQ